MLKYTAIHMNSLKRDRMIRVYLPKSYPESTISYPVLYMHDGQNLYKDEEAVFGTSWGVTEVLDRNSLDLIVVGIDSPSHGWRRFNEYGPWENRDLGDSLCGSPRILGGEGDRYVKFIAEQLKPWIDEQYRTHPEDAAMAGSSMGGLISTYAACRYPHIFRRIASLSSAYWFNQKEIEALIDESDLSAIDKFYLDVGTHESTGDIITPRHYVEAGKAVYNRLKTKVGNLRFQLVEGGIHHESAWRSRFPEVLQYLYGKLEN